MKLSTGKCRIVGIQVGEAQVNFVDPRKKPLTAKLVLLGEDGSPIGWAEGVSDWSEKTMKLFRELSESMEDDVKNVVFDEGQAPAPPQEAAKEPEQF